MRHEGQSSRESQDESQETTGYTFYFQITNNGGRQACSVKIAAPSLGDATAFFRQNWPAIESLARDNLARSPGASCPILVDPSMPVSSASAESVDGEASASVLNMGDVQSNEPPIGPAVR